MPADSNTLNAAAPAANEASPLIPKGKGLDLPRGGASPPPAGSILHAATAPPQGPPRKTDTQGSGWGDDPAGLPPRGANDDNLAMFRRALGINAGVASDAQGTPTLEEGRKTAAGIYRQVLREQRSKAMQHHVLGALLYFCHFAQIIVGAVLTALGPAAAEHSVAITILGAANTVTAGVLALIKGQGLPERLRHDEVEFRRLQDWIEETEALLAAGIVGRDRRETGRLVEMAFKKYNAVKASEENNKPDAYVRQPVEGPQRVLSRGGASDDYDDDDKGKAVVGVRERHGRTASASSAPTLQLDGNDNLASDDDDGRSHGSGNAIVRLNMPVR